MPLPEEYQILKSKKYQIFTIVTIILSGVILLYFGTFNMNTTFSCDKTKNVCNIEHQNFFGIREKTNIALSDIAKAENIPSVYSHSKMHVGPGGRGIYRDNNNTINEYIHTPTLTLKTEEYIPIYTLNTSKTFNRASEIDKVNHLTAQINDYLKSTENNLWFHRSADFSEIFCFILFNLIFFSVLETVVLILLLPLILYLIKNITGRQFFH